MRYRIILEEDGNGEQHYEVQFREKCWHGFKWVNTKKFRESGFDEYYVTAKYPTLEEAQHVVKARSVMRYTYEEGVVYERDVTE